jgi:hypothetical protein
MANVAILKPVPGAEGAEAEIARKKDVLLREISGPVSRRMTGGRDKDYLYLLKIQTDRLISFKFEFRSIEKPSINSFTPRM